MLASIHGLLWVDPRPKSERSAARSAVPGLARLVPRQLPCRVLPAPPETAAISRRPWGLWFAPGLRRRRPSHVPGSSGFRSTIRQDGRRTMLSPLFARGWSSHPNGTDALVRAAGSLLIL